MNFQNNNRNSVTNAFVRIFMAPRYKSTTSQERYTFEEQRKLFFAMDSFVQICELRAAELIDVPFN